MSKIMFDATKRVSILFGLETETRAIIMDIKIEKIMTIVNTISDKLISYLYPVYISYFVF